MRRADSSARTNARSTRAASLGFLFRFWVTVFGFMVLIPSITWTRPNLPAATREISQMLVNCLGRSAELLSLLFCDLSGGLVSLPASQQVYPTSGRLLGERSILKPLIRLIYFTSTMSMSMKLTVMSNATAAAAPNRVPISRKNA